MTNTVFRSYDFKPLYLRRYINYNKLVHNKIVLTA